MKVLITGGSGFIGSHIADNLLERGDDVLVIDDYTTGRRHNLTKREGLTIVEGSITDPTAVATAFDDFVPEVVVHAAASYKDPDAWAEDAAVNVMGTALVTKAALRHDVRRLIYFQTALCYGLHPDQQPITIDHELRPLESSYAISKTAGEHYIRLSGIDWVSFRLANGYGPRNITGPLPTFYERLTNGKPVFVMDTRRDFVFVEDLVRIVVRAIDGEGSPGPYHVSSGRDYSIKELFDATVAALGIELDEEVEVRPRSEDDAYTLLLDPSATYGAFPGWEVTTPLEDGVKRAVRYYREFGVQETFTHLRVPDDES